jgi:hypothetical protein
MKLGTGWWARARQYRPPRDRRLSLPTAPPRHAALRTRRPPRDAHRRAGWSRAAARRLRRQLTGIDSRAGRSLPPDAASRPGARPSPAAAFPLQRRDPRRLRPGHARPRARLVPGIAPPRRGRLVYIAGHHRTHGAPFRHVADLDRGDAIEIVTPYATATYTVTGHTTVPQTDFAVLRSPAHELLRLQTSTVPAGPDGSS